MELRQLRYFVALAEHRHFGRAAEAVHIAQPSLSQQIKALEQHLSTKLFERSRRHVALTPDGEALLPYARRMLSLAEDAKAELADRRNLLKGQIRVGATPTLGGYLLPRLLRHFHLQYPGLDLTITEDGSDHLARKLNESRLDFALTVKDSGLKRRDITFEFLLKERIFVGLPHDHPFSGRADVSLIELQDEGFILCREGYHLRGLTLDACQSVGFVPRVTVSGTDVDTALRFVQAGMGVTLLPEFVANATHGISTLALKEPSLFRHVGVAWKSQRYLSKAAMALLTSLREACAKLTASA